MEIFHKLGVNGSLLLAQAVNFIVLLWILKRFAYGPLLAFLDKRAARIAQGLEDAAAAKKQLEEACAQQDVLLAAARDNAKAIIAHAEETAKRQGAVIVAEMTERGQAIIVQAERAAQDAHTRMMRDAQTEIADLVLATVEKVLHEKSRDAQDHTRIVQFLASAKEKE